MVSKFEINSNCSRSLYSIEILPELFFLFKIFTFNPEFFQFLWAFKILVSTFLSLYFLLFLVRYSTFLAYNFWNYFFCNRWCVWNSDERPCLSSKVPSSNIPITSLGKVNSLSVTYMTPTFRHKFGNTFVVIFEFFI